MAEHTPTPWYDDGYRFYAPTENEDPRNSQVIYEYKQSDNPNVYEDAAFTLLAVNSYDDMLEALTDLLDTDGTTPVEEYFEIEQSARAAIAKATGTAVAS